MERLGDLLPDAARQLGLDDELELAAAMTAWQKIVAERIPAAVGACRVTALAQGIATIEADEPIVAQELRLRSPELAAALRSAVRGPVRQLRVTARHV
jgi:predicted nucleic acid-binding Zn ribbon protein